MKSDKKKLRVVELFAGVGGFRLGLEGWKGKSSTSGYSKKMSHDAFKVIWSNQFEPLTSPKNQPANDVYKVRWPNIDNESIHCGEDIADVKDQVPEHDVLVGGFPCQDYSVATTLRNSKGMLGKKGVLWWEIDSIIKKQKNKPRYLILENVDRLLVSPAAKRGRDFAVMLWCLNKHGYDVEWRVINAADYGMPQRRRRVFILGFLRENGSSLISSYGINELISSKGVLSSEFKIQDLEHDPEMITDFNKEWKDVQHVSTNFNFKTPIQRFYNAGAMMNGKVYSAKTEPDKESKVTLGDIVALTRKKEIEDEFIIDKEEKLTKEMRVVHLDKNGKDRIEIYRTKGEVWNHLKDKKTLSRTSSATGARYKFAEGAMVFPDSLNEPSRTIITGEGGPSPSRFKHVIEYGKKIRRLVPVELERLNMFPPNHTYLDDKVTPPTKRAFFMGNALVVGIVERIGNSLLKKINE